MLSIYTRREIILFIDEQSCNRLISTPGLILTIMDYLSMYDARGQCTWTLQASEGNFLLLNISMLKLAPAEEPYIVSYLGKTQFDLSCIMSGWI